MNNQSTKFKSMAIGIVAILGCVHANAMAAAKLDDATILAIFDQANSVDIWAGRLGVQKGKSAEVRALGKMVATDHEAVQQMGRDLAKKMGVIPTPPANDKSAENLAKTIALLDSKSGADFDKAYIQHEIAFHQSVIDAIKTTLLPAITSPEFKKLVNDVLPGFEHHLTATKAAAKKLGIPER
jgi:putative membrane protein